MEGLEECPILIYQNAQSTTEEEFQRGSIAMNLKSGSKVTQVFQAHVISYHINVS